MYHLPFKKYKCQAEAKTLVSSKKKCLLTLVCLRLCGCEHGAGGGHSANLDSAVQRIYTPRWKRPLTSAYQVKEVLASTNIIQTSYLRH